MQDRVAKGELKIVKVKGEDNVWFDKARRQAKNGAVFESMRVCKEER